MTVAQRAEERKLWFVNGFMLQKFDSQSQIKDVKQLYPQNISVSWKVTVAMELPVVGHSCRLPVWAGRTLSPWRVRARVRDKHGLGSNSDGRAARLKQIDILYLYNLTLYQYKFTYNEYSLLFNFINSSAEENVLWCDVAKVATAFRTFWSNSRLLKSTILGPKLLLLLISNYWRRV